MNLQELSASKPIKHLQQVFENHFDQKINLNHLDFDATALMLSRVRGVLNEHQNSTTRHWGERNPAYLKLIMMEQALHSHLAEITPPATDQTAQISAQAMTQIKDPKLAAALKKSMAGQALTRDEQELVTKAALTKTENKLYRAYNVLKESEVEQAQVVLAAQDMVDKVQSMLEDVSELQFKDLPALVDAIKNQVGIEQATQFNTDASTALTGLLKNIQVAKQQLDVALGVVTGQPQVTPDLAGMADTMNPEVDAGLAAGNADSIDSDRPEPAAASLGRERR